MQPDFLIVTNKRDLTSDFIVREMRTRGHQALRINTEDAPDIKVTHDLTKGTLLSVRGRNVALSSLRAAYFRRPLPPEIDCAGLSPAAVRYVREEWSYLLRSLYLEIDDKWFSHPNNIILAEDKPKQLRLAREIGFSVPETVITNNLASVRGLFSSGEVVAKPLKQSLLDDGKGPGSVIFTSSIAAISDIDEESLRLAPVIFQRKLHKRYDIRVTVVEDDIFPVAILSQQFEKTQTDWRHSSVVELSHEIISLPAAMQEKCREIVRRLKLRFGAIDLVMDEVGGIWFLECNPNGQWAWIENRTGLPIAASIVSSMERM